MLRVSLLYLKTAFLPILLFCILCFPGCRKAEPPKSFPPAVKGVIDLRSVESDSQNFPTIPLDGEWIFTWNEFVDPILPDEFFNRQNAFINVPSQWQKEKDPAGNHYPAYGYASYVLKILLPENHPDLSISMSDTGMAYDLYINGILHSSNGKVGKTKEEMTISQRYTVFPVKERSRSELILVIHDSNFHYFKAGLWQSLVIGERETIHHRYFSNLSLDLIVASSLLIMGLYHLGLFLDRRKDKSPLYFGLFCILVMIRTITIKERLIYEVFPDIPYLLVHKLEYFSFYYGSVFFLKFIYSIFTEECNAKIFKLFRIGFEISSAVVILFPMSIYTRTLIFVQGLILVGIIYTLYIVIVSVIRKRLGAKSFLAGLILFFLAIINDILRTRGILYTPFLASYGLLFFVISQAIVLSRRFANAFVLSENLSDELTVLSGQLEQKVLQRTEELNRALNSIQKDLYYAKRIQNKSLAIDFSRIAGLKIATYYSAMTEVGGDFYGVSKLKENRYRFFLADVTGHGIQAALITMAVKGIYDDIKNYQLSPAYLLGLFNDEFVEKYQSLNSLLTCIFLDIDISEKKIYYSSAGHPPCILLDENGIQLLEKTGRMVGITKNNKYSVVEKNFEEGNRIYLFSDGIYEQFDSDLQEFGEEKLYSQIRQSSNEPIDETIRKIITELENFLGSSKKQDDITIIGIEYSKSNSDTD